jgi:hypothetical protein
VYDKKSWIRLFVYKCGRNPRYFLLILFVIPPYVSLRQWVCYTSDCWTWMGKGEIELCFLVWVSTNGWIRWMY